MRTIWLSSGDSVNIREAKEASVSTMIQYEYLVKEDRQLEAALLLVESLLQFKEDISLIKEISAEEFGKFVQEWMESSDENL
jgi:hypothetical protein